MTENSRTREPLNSERGLAGSVLERVPCGPDADGSAPAGDLSECSSLVTGPGHDFLTGVEFYPPARHLRSVIRGLRRLLHDAHSIKVTFRDFGKWVLARRQALRETAGQTFLVRGF